MREKILRNMLKCQRKHVWCNVVKIDFLFCALHVSYSNCYIRVEHQSFLEKELIEGFVWRASIDIILYRTKCI